MQHQQQNYNQYQYTKKKKTSLGKEMLSVSCYGHFNKQDGNP